MATSAADIREGIRANLAAVYQSPSLAPADQVQCSAYMLEAPVGAILQVKGPEDIEYNESLGRTPMSIWTMIIQGFSGTALDKAAQTLLDGWISIDGVKAAVEADRTLGGVVHDCVIARCRHYGMFHLPSGMSFLGAEWTATVLVPGS